MIIIKSSQEIERMKEAGKIVAEVHNEIQDNIAPGISTYELDQIAERIIKKHKAIPSFKGYGGFPASICASVNEEVVHGIPSKKVILKDGDIISIDVGAKINGFHGDAARTHAVGKICSSAKKLMEVTKQSFFEGLKYCTTEHRLYDVSHAIQKYVEENGFSVVRDLVGHGIGRDLHEDPQVPNFGKSGYGPRLTKGMVLAIEPMVNQGTYDVRVLDDQWTVVTADKKLSAHYENTIAITEGQPEILTMTNRGEL